ncbi:MAG: hypothetical protein QNJ44_21455 [Rhodobacter sp.]|nr:hypothetical protein [Rhodobacter sp.]
MSGNIDGMSDGYIARDDFSRLDRFDDIWGLEAKVEPKISIAKPKPDYVEGFVLDLDLAGRRAVECVKRLVVSARGREKLFTAFDGASSNDRSRDDLLAMLHLLSPLLEEDDIGFADLGDTCEIPLFCPAFSGLPSEPGQDCSYLQKDCACAVDLDGGRIFVSTDLGFRDVMMVSQLAMAQMLILRLERAGPDIDVAAALPRVCDVLGCEPAEHLDGGAFAETSVMHRGSRIPASRVAGTAGT